MFLERYCIALKWQFQIMIRFNLGFSFQPFFVWIFKEKGWGEWGLPISGLFSILNCNITCINHSHIYRDRALENIYIADYFCVSVYRLLYQYRIIYSLNATKTDQTIKVHVTLTDLNLFSICIFSNTFQKLVKTDILQIHDFYISFLSYYLNIYNHRQTLIGKCFREIYPSARYKWRSENRSKYIYILHPVHGDSNS